MVQDVKVNSGQYSSRGIGPELLFRHNMKQLSGPKAFSKEDVFSNPLEMAVS